MASLRRPLLSRSSPGPRPLAGLVLYAATHATLLPVMGQQAPLQKHPGATLIWEPGSHIAYGVALDGALRALA